ncbi:aminotransferase class V-fold PLP-dependent enzyme [Enterococcus lactis]|nr:aminotransferase class V-fold PLP-dependent enzyme [Enterococcus lactis]
MNTIYLVHAATTPLHPQVILAMSAFMQETFGNPSSIHGFCRHAHEKWLTARQFIAESLL